MYDLYSDAELAEEVVWLKAQLRNPFLSQTEGPRAVSRSTAEFRDRLAAATQVLRSRSATDLRHGEADFSGVKV